DLAAGQGTGAPPAALDLPFAPRGLLAVPGSARMIVADAFAGKLAVVDLRRRAVESVRDLAGHNLRGLALDRAGKHLLLAHQTLQSQGHPTPGEIRSGALVNNVVRRIPLADLLTPGADILRGERLYSLGDVDLGAADPADLAEAGDSLLVTVAGAHELHVGRPEEVLWTRLAVGR